MSCNVFCVIWMYIWDGIGDYRLDIYENMSYDGKLDIQQETTEYISRNISSCTITTFSHTKST
jgi:hypothetical protein